MTVRNYRRRSFSTMPAALPPWLISESLGAGKTIVASEYVPAPKPKREKPVWRAMTDLERVACASLCPGIISYLPGSIPKRIGRDLAAQAAADDPQITDKQASLLWRQAWAYRRQIADVAVLREARRRHGEATA